MTVAPQSLASRQEKYQAGKELRARVSRESQADYARGADRDPLAILAETNRSRLPELVPIRLERMAASPFAFLRGAAAIMAQDLSQAAKLDAPVQSCGDAHLLNFGAFNTPEGRALFDINDFDETLPGADFTVDLKRLVTSVAVAAQDEGLSENKAKSLAVMTAKAYREFVLELATKAPLEVWYTRMDVNDEAQRIDDPKLRKRVLATLIKAEKDLQADDNFPHLATTNGGRAHIEDRPPLIYHFDVEGSGLSTIDPTSVFASYRGTLLPERRDLVERYALADIAIKVVGVGSVGTFCAVGLFMTPDQDHMFLQVKEAQTSALERIVPPPQDLSHQGQRVVEGQRAMQAASDIFLGWTADQKSNRQFYIRQLKNRRLGSIGEVIELKALGPYANLCGRTLARAHARTGDPALMAGYMGKSDVFDDAIASFAMAYAEQTKEDHARLKASREASPGQTTAAGKKAKTPVSA